MADNSFINSPLYGLYPVYLSKFQAKELLRCLSCLRLTMSDKDILVLDELIDILENFLKRIDDFENSSGNK